MENDSLLLSMKDKDGIKNHLELDLELNNLKTRLNTIDSARNVKINDYTEK